MEDNTFAKLNGTRPSPFNLEELRIDPSTTDDQINTERLLLKVPVRRPDRQTFIRTHPDPAYAATLAVLELHEERTAYLVHPKIAVGFPRDARRVILATAIDRAGVVFLIPIKLPLDGRQDDWSDSLLEGVRQARDCWTKIASNQSLGAYEISVATAAIPGPTWPTKTYQELLEIAFRDKFIDRVDHPVLLRLEGRI
jgi:hypothetical protein